MLLPQDAAMFAAAPSADIRYHCCRLMIRLRRHCMLAVAAADVYCYFH